MSEREDKIKVKFPDPPDPKRRMPENIRKEWLKQLRRKARQMEAYQK